jgi:hypothetical protein
MPGYLKYHLCKVQAEHDAPKQAHPRGPSKFVNHDTKICQLCGCGLGKRCSKADRQEHQNGPEHVAMYQVYVEHFAELRELYLAWWEEEEKTAHLNHAAEGRIWQLNHPNGCIALRTDYGWKSGRLPNGAHDCNWNLHPNAATGLGKLSKCPNVVDWLNVSGNLVPLKMALADLLMFSSNADQHLLRAREELRKHVHYAQVILCHRIANGALTNNPNGAHTVATFLIAHVTSSIAQ